MGMIGVVRTAGPCAKMNARGVDKRITGKVARIITRFIGSSYNETFLIVNGLSLAGPSITPHLTDRQAVDYTKGGTRETFAGYRAITSFLGHILQWPTNEHLEFRPGSYQFARKNILFSDSRHQYFAELYALMVVCNIQRSIGCLYAIWIGNGTTFVEHEPTFPRHSVVFGQPSRELAPTVVPVNGLAVLD